MFNTFEIHVLRLLLILVKLAQGGEVTRADQGVLDTVERVVQSAED
jgi:hypothetical protein